MNYREMNIDQKLMKITVSDFFRVQSIMATIEFFRKKYEGIPLKNIFEKKDYHIRL